MVLFKGLFGKKNVAVNNSSLSASGVAGAPNNKTNTGNAILNSMRIPAVSNSSVKYLKNLGLKVPTQTLRQSIENNIMSGGKRKTRRSKQKARKTRRRY